MKRTAPRQKRDQLGRRLCRQCEALVPRGRVSYCSAACREAFEVAYFPSFTRRAVFKRDKGVCAKCGCDTEKIRRIFSWMRWNGARREIAAVAHALGFNGWIHDGAFWQADHIQECARGGWGTGLENFRTLCTPCHKDETRRLARELAEARRDVKATLFAAAGKGGAT